MSDKTPEPQFRITTKIKPTTRPRLPWRWHVVLETPRNPGSDQYWSASFASMYPFFKDEVTSKGGNAINRDAADLFAKEAESEFRQLVARFREYQAEQRQFAAMEEVRRSELL